MRKGYCITSDESPDSFVGIRFHEGVPEVVFPHGFIISDDEKERRRDVFKLLSVLQRFTDKRDGERAKCPEKNLTSLPLTSYQYIIQDFLAHGYYTEREIRYIEDVKGKINWKKTIQHEQPHLDGNNIVYLQFQVKTNQINNDALLTKIHQYCVYKSLFRFGWLYLTTDYLPQKPSFKADKKLFITTLKQALNHTFNDSKKKLFQSMINIMVAEEDEVLFSNESIGVNKFETVWEKLTDYVFGEENKEKYFPHATWHILKNNVISTSRALVPDTIMKYHGNIYVLDAKYYQYGITDSPSDLPQASSIQKQITYGKHIFEHKNELDPIPANDIYSAFVLPYAAPTGEKYRFVSVGTADWEKYNINTLNYAYVLAILLDTKWLITSYSKHNETEIEKLATLIEDSLIEYRKRINTYALSRANVYSQNEDEWVLAAETTFEYGNKQS